MNIRSISQTSEKVDETYTAAENNDMNRLSIDKNKRGVTSTDGTSTGTMANGERENIQAKLLEGHKQAKITQEKSNIEIKKQFTDMKALMTENSNKFDVYVKTNETKVAKAI